MAALARRHFFTPNIVKDFSDLLSWSYHKVEARLCQIDQENHLALRRLATSHYQEIIIKMYDFTR